MFEAQPRTDTTPAPKLGTAKQSGFSLLEVIIAVAVFALVAAAGYAGLDALSRAAAFQREAAQRLEQLQLAIALLEQDLSQTTARPVGTQNGRTLAAFTGDQNQLTFTRSGWANPLNLPRSALKRVQWRFDGSQLQRFLWPVLDQVSLTPPELDSQLGDLRDLQFRYMESGGRWLDQWPPSSGVEVDANLELPRAVEISFYREPAYRVHRIVELARR